MATAQATQHRVSVDCRDMPAINRQTGQTCSLKISGGDREVLEAAVQHAVAAHGEKDTPEFREAVTKMMREEAYC